MVSTRGAATLAAGVALSVGCGQPTLPGESVGAFAVSGTITENSCGTTLPLVDPLVFDVELRNDQGVAYWRRPQSALFAGLWTGPHFTFGTEDAVVVTDPRPYDEPPNPGCTLVQRVVIQGTLAGGGDGGVLGDAGPHDAGEVADAGIAVGEDAGGATMASGFAGTQRITYTPRTGSDCALLVPPQGTQFAVLPCTVTYTLTATRAAEF